MSGVSTESPVATPLQTVLAAAPDSSGAQFAAWRNDVRQAAKDAVAEFVEIRCASELAGAGVPIAADVLDQFISGGKYLRSTFMYLGWRCGAGSDDAALRASASLELLHVFALLQDDVMDDSAVRRGRTSAHAQFERWHRDNELPGSAQRFGESAAILLGDLCLVWAEQMLRGSGVSPAALDRVWPRYDAMRTEVAVGQFADLVNVTHRLPSLEDALDIAARKSDNYTVRRPVEIGAAMAGCGERSLWLLGRYGTAVGEAVQLRDDLLGIFGSASVTGKPSGDDLRDHKATSVVVAAHHLADATTRSQLAELSASAHPSESDIERWRALISATGAVDWIEDMITDRVAAAQELVYRLHIDESVQAGLASMAGAYAVRST